MIGSIRVREIKLTSFRGKHNATKSKCLLILGYSETARQQRGWLTARQLAALTGIPYASVLASLPKWVQWKIVIRKEARLTSGKEAYIYQLAPKGRAWLLRHTWHMPLQRYHAEMLKTTGRAYDWLRLMSGN